MTESGPAVAVAAGPATRAVAALSRTARFVAGLLLVAMTGYTLVEIALRMSGHATNVVVEFVGYGLAAMTFLAAGGTMREGGMVRVGLLLSRAPPRLRRMLDVLCIACGIATIAVAAWFIGREMLQSYDRGYETDSLVPLPLWLPPMPLLLGLVAFLLDMSVQLVLVTTGRVELPSESLDVA